MFQDKVSMELLLLYGILIVWAFLVIRTVQCTHLLCQLTVFN